MCTEVADLSVKEVLGLQEVLKQVEKFLKGGNSASLLFNLPIVNDEESLYKAHRRFIVPLFDYLKVNNDFSCSCWPDLTPSLEEVLRQGFFLEEPALLDLAHFLLEAKKIRNLLIEKNLGKDLTDWALSLPDLTYLAEKLAFFIKNDSELNEEAVPEMRSLRTSILIFRKKITNKAQSFLEKHDSCLREDIVEREGRVLLGLKSNFKGRFKGLVHASSASGQTLFFEPYELVELNNEKISLEQDYRSLRLKVLRELSEDIRLHTTALDQLWAELAVFDTWRARALYAISTAGSYPCLASRDLSLIQARHPLLKKPVPIDLCLPLRKKALIITGPNAGGKTLTLKTVGLFALMNQIGLAIPVNEQSTLPIFDQIFADIGDDQSLLNSLSTFSARMKKTVYLQVKATNRSLVLLDELGSATDPEQGLALAQALLENLIDKACLLICSTHFSYLKYLAYTYPQAINASLTVDQDSLLPNYCLKMGVAGESYAFSVARSQGLALSILERAQELYRTKQTQESVFMEKLACKERELSQEQELLQKKMAELSLSLAELSTRQEVLLQKERELLEREIKKETNFIQQARQSLERMQEELFISCEPKKKWKDCKRETESWQGYIEEKQNYKESLNPVPLMPPSFKEGSQVLLKAYGSKGIVLRPDKKNTWLVSTGSLKVVVPSSELELLEESGKSFKGFAQQRSSGDYIVKTQEKALFSLDVRGMRLQESIKAVNKQLERACVQGLMKFSLIHGLGNGVLQEGLHKLLKEHIHVEKFHLADPHEGGVGKTWVYLKNSF